MGTDSNMKVERPYARGGTDDVGVASDPANVRDGVIAVPTYRSKTVFTVSDVHIRYSAVVCAIPLGFSWKQRCIT